jgi:hypothetical protein
MTIMSTSVATCPYCNSVTPAPAGAAGGERLTCPRCGEFFSYRPPEAEGSAPARPQSAASPFAAASTAPVGRRWPNWALALAVLGGMAVIAGATVAFVLGTIDFRRNNDYFPTEPEPAVVAPVLPRHLGGLAYLPKDTSTVAALHVAAALRDPAGREFLIRFRAGDFLPLPPKIADAISIERLPQLTGLTLEEVDHIVVGTNLDAPDAVPPLTMVVETRRPYDPAKIREVLDARRSPTAERELYDVQLARTLPGVLWFAGRTTLVIGVKSVPEGPHSGRSHLEPAVREVLERRLDQPAQAWVIAHSADWTRTAGGLLLAPRLADPTRAALEKVRTAGAWLAFGQELRLGGAVECADAESVARVARLLQPAGDHKPIHVFGDRGAWSAVATELGEELQVVEAGTWLTLRARARPETVQQALTADLSSGK